MHLVREVLVSAKCIDKTTEMLSKLGKGGQEKINHRLKNRKGEIFRDRFKVQRVTRERERHYYTGVLQCAVLSGRRLQ